MPRIRYSAEIRQHAVTLVLDSHLPIQQVAQDIGCSVNALQNWLKKHRQQNSPPSNPAVFVPINVIDHPLHSAEIILPNGITIRLTDAAPQYLAELLHALIPC